MSMEMGGSTGWRMMAISWAIALLASASGVRGEPGQAVGDLEPAPQLRGLAVSTHFSRRGGGWRIEDLVPAMRAAGFSAVRDEITWESVEREKGVYRIPDVARDWLDQVAEAEIDLIILLTYGNRLHDNPLDPQAFARYAAYLVEELADHPVVAWEIWNEPHNFGFRSRYGGAWNGSRDAPWLEKFAELVEVTAEAIRLVDPEATIITGAGTPPDNVHLMVGFPDALREIDGLTEHPYTYRYPPETVPFGGEHNNERDEAKTADDDHSMTSMFRLLREHSGEHLGHVLPLWCTEFGYSTFSHHPPAAERGIYAGFTEQTQAMYHARALLQALGAEVDNWTIYDLMDDGRDAHNAEHRFGLVRHASEGYEPKPALYTIRRISRLLGGQWQRVAEPPAAMEVVADERLERSALQRPGSDSVSAVVTGPRVYWFRAGGEYVSFHWRAGRRDAEHHPPPVRFEWEQGRGVEPIEAIDVVTAEVLALDAGDGHLRGLDLRASPTAVRWRILD